MIVDVRNCISNSFLSRNCVCVHYTLSAVLFFVFFIFFNTRAVVNEWMKGVATKNISFFVVVGKFRANSYQN